MIINFISQTISGCEREKIALQTKLSRVESDLARCLSEMDKLKREFMTQQESDHDVIRQRQIDIDNLKSRLDDIM